MQPAKILVVEDSKADIEMLRIALAQQDKDYELEVLMDGEAALQFVHEHEQVYGCRILASFFSICICRVTTVSQSCGRFAKIHHWSTSESWC